jgi:adenine phosphoribosyltransferase
MTGGSASAAGELVAKQCGNVVQYLFIAEVSFLKGSAKLKAPVYTMIQLNS